MNLPVLTMAARSLRVDSRSPTHYALRGGLVALLVVALGGAVYTSDVLGAPGLNFFTILVYLNILLLTLMGVAGFSSVITEERESENLDLLTLAGFAPISILLGKSFGHFVNTVQLIALQLPFAVLAATLGGVSSRQVFAVYVVLGAYAAMLFGLGALSSVVCRLGLSAARLTAAAAGIWVIGGPVAEFVIDALADAGVVSGAAGTGFQNAIHRVSELSPVIALQRILETNFRGAVLSPVVWINAVVGVVLWIWAYLRFRRECAGNAKVREVRIQKHSGRRLSRPAPRSKALIWKDFHFRAGGKPGIVLRAWLYGVVFLVVGVLTYDVSMGVGQSVTTWGSAMMALMVVAAVIETGIQAGRVFREEMQEDTLFGLALLPTRIGTWAFAKVHGCMYVIIVPAVYFTVAFTLVAVSVSVGESAMALALTSMTLLYLAIALAFAVHVTAWLSLYLPKGAFPVTIAGFAIGYGLVLLSVQTTSAACCSATLIPVPALLASASLQVMVARRLRQCAAQ